MVAGELGGRRQEQQDFSGWCGAGAWRVSVYTVWGVGEDTDTPGPKPKMPKAAARWAMSQ